jgi:exopolyphosphatase/guanosine-5'-triphosphate,3'-diphosphate pyrophosphatase
MTPERPKAGGARPRRRRFYKAPGPLAEPYSPQCLRPSELYAALDLGTNSCRMLIARPRGSQFDVVDSFSRTVQLGHNLEVSGRLGRESMLRTLQALQICQTKIKSHGITKMRLVATEACRRASNAAEFIRRVKCETGLKLEVITPEEEACFAVISCAPLVGHNTTRLLVVDIGGGSTELVWIDLSDVVPKERARAIMRLHVGFGADLLETEGPEPRAKVIDWISVPLGVATLKDQFSDVNDDGARFALMSWFFEEHLADFTPYQNTNPVEGFQIIGTSGTVTTVAASFLGLRRYDRTKLTGLACPRIR